MLGLLNTDDVHAVCFESCFVQLNKQLLGASTYLRKVRVLSRFSKLRASFLSRVSQLCRGVLAVRKVVRSKLANQTRDQRIRGLRRVVSYEPRGGADGKRQKGGYAIRK